MDFIKQIQPAFSKEHTFIIVATDYFTKWVEASAVKTITSVTVKKFIETRSYTDLECPRQLSQTASHLSFQMK
ncbi:hypothetical protein ACFXTI_028364 [Malus domestica]